MKSCFVVLYTLDNITTPVVFSTWEKMQEFTQLCKKKDIQFSCYERTIDRY